MAPLDSVGWLATQPAEFVDWVAAVGRWRSLPKGAFVYHAEDPPDGLHGLAAGALEITFPLVAEEPVTVHRAEVGFWVGDAALLSDTPRMISIMAAEDSRVLHLPARAVRRFLATRPEHWRAFYQLGAINIGITMRLLSETLALTVRARVCRRLLALSGEDGAARVTQETLAKLVGVTRATLQRVLADIATQGAIERRYGVVRVLERSVLERWADEQ